MKEFEPELGQIVFGKNLGGDFAVPRYADAFIQALLFEVERVYWNINQEKWDRLVDPQIPGLVFRAYYWGDDSVEAEKPNLSFDFSPQEIRWYKYPGRGQSASVDFLPSDWIDWFEKGFEVILSADCV
jgi:hypothetical protein